MKKNGGILAPKLESENEAQQTAENENTSDSTSSSLVREIKVCLSSKPLMCIIAAQSICIAIFAVLTTFGGAFLLALDLFESETQGASLFSLTAGVASLMGMPVGGLLVDKVLSKHKRNDDQLSSEAKNDTNDVNDANNENDENDKNDTNTVNTTNNTDKTRNRIQSLRQLKSLLPIIISVVTCGIFVCYPTLLCTSATPFLAFLFCGFLFLFAAQAGITTSIMLAVPGSHRSNAIAFAALMAHVFGDVPSPIVFGWLKDRLAPACVMTADGEFVNADRCQVEHIGVRTTIGIAYLWITISLFFFEMARRMTIKEMHRLEMGSGYWAEEQERKKELERIERRKVLENSLFPVRRLDHGETNEFDSEFEMVDRSDYGDIL